MKNFEPKTQFRPSAAINLVSPRSTTLALPLSLAGAVRTVVRSVNESTLRPVASQDAGVAFQPKILLAVTLYCYLHDLYGSEDMEDALRRDAAFRTLCHQEFPGARVLRRFRRENREALHHSLKAVLWYLELRKAEAGFSRSATDTELAEEATRRIGKAMFIDSMESE